MRVEEFDYPLPKSLIAQFPLEKRDCSRLLVVDRLTGELSHTYFSNITDFFKPGDLLILNDTKVIPARLKGVRETGGHVEIFLSRPVYENNFLLWESLVKPSKKVKLGMTLKLKDGLFAKVEAEKSNGIKIIRFTNNGAFFEMIEKVGEIPLPPYIHREADAIDKKRYQTVFAKEKGAVAAPTAGLHFTVELIEKIKNMGVKIEFVTLHVGIGTFLPVRRKNVEEHVMHSEYFYISEKVADKINETKSLGKRVIAVGTTVVRCLESASDDKGRIKPQRSFTDLFIYPGYKFKVVDSLITNFHLPKSTLIMLVSAFAGKDLIFKAYNEAIRRKYRFLSYGDAMFIK